MPGGCNFNTHTYFILISYLFHTYFILISILILTHSMPVGFITSMGIEWGNNRQFAASQYAMCGGAVVVESCAAWRLQAEGFAVF